MSIQRQGPLAGVRILDHFGMWAGPLSTSLLAGLGAEVIKVESIQRYDALRLLRICQPGEDGYEWSAAFNGNNHGKMDVTLDLKDPRGRRLFLDLVATSDIVTESYRPDAAAKLGITYEDLVQVRPDLIYLALSGFGASGPWAERPGYGATFSQVTGLASVNGYGDGTPPVGDGSMWYSDVFNASIAAFSLITALHQRDATGKGQRIEQAQVEVTSLLALEYTLGAMFGGPESQSAGNYRPGPENVYPCLPGEEQEFIPALAVTVEEGKLSRIRLDEWIAISITSDEEWRRFCASAGERDFVTDDRFATAVGRLRDAAELDTAIARWTAENVAAELAERLQAAGVRAAAVANHAEALATDHFHERGDLQVLDRPVSGSHLYVGFPFLFDTAVEGWQTGAPTLGQDNVSVLRDLLGLDEATYQRLAADTVIGQRPIWRPVT